MACISSLNFVLYICLAFVCQNQLVESFDYDYVTCGSVVKLMNKAFQVRLHSHDVKYGSGSGQQSVTGMTNQDDGNSYWQIKGETGKDCRRGETITCGQAIRLNHVKTGKNLHSHHFAAPMSTNQYEVSAFGEGGEGDHLDHWVVTCSGSQKLWSRKEHVRFKHSETNSYLSCSQNTYGRPIHGQQEVLGSVSDAGKTSNYWKAVEGIYIRPTENSTEK